MMRAFASTATIHSPIGLSRGRSHPPHRDRDTAFGLVAAEDLLVPRPALGAVEYHQVPFGRTAAVHVRPRLRKTLAQRVVGTGRIENAEPDLGDERIIERFPCTASQRAQDGAHGRSDVLPGGLAAAVRKALDERDGFQGRKREEMYRMFSELAAHPTMKSAYLMRPQKDGDAVIGPFIAPDTLEAVISEIGRLAVQASEVLDPFFPETWADVLPARADYARGRLEWFATFYPPKRPATPS